MSKKKRQAKRRGFSMLMVLLAVVILFFVGVGSLRLGLDTRLLAIRTNHEIEARSARCRIVVQLLAIKWLQKV